MKFTLTLARRRTLTRAEAWGCFSANLAMPGAGSLAAGRKVGYAQLLLALAGMGLTLGMGIGALRWGLANWARLNSPSADSFEVLEEMWQHMRWPLLGILIFAVAIAWAALTGWRLVCAAPKDGVPPRIT